MDIKQVKALAQVLRHYDLSAVEVGEGENKIRLERNITAAVVPAQPAVSAASAREPVTVPAGKGTPAQNLIEVKAPMVGVFYGAAAPGEAPFVQAGSRVKKGDVLCIIEAMKLMNELPAEAEGEIVEVCAKDGEIVEYGQTLFKLAR